MREKSCRRRTRGRSYAVVIQQLSGEVDNLHEALRQLQLENRDLKLRQEVLEQWCRINRLALQAMRTCGGVLLGGQQQDLPQAAIAAIEDAEEWIQKQLVDYDPVPADDAAELPPPKASSSGSSASCTLQGQALSLMEYALRYLLAHPQRYAHVSGMIEPDVALEVVQGLRERARSLLAAVEGQPSPLPGDAGDKQSNGVSSCRPGTTGGSGRIPGMQGVTRCVGAAPQPISSTSRAEEVCAAAASKAAAQSAGMPDTLQAGVCPGTSAAAAAGAPSGAAPEAALQQLAEWMLHCWTVVICCQVLDPTITYGCVHRAAQLAGPPTRAKLQSVVAALQLSPEQCAQIAARVRVVFQLLEPVNAAWNELLGELRQVLLALQRQQQQQQQQKAQQQVQVEGLTATAAPTTAAPTAAAGGAGQAAARAEGPDPGPAPPASSKHGQPRKTSSVAAGSRGQCAADHQAGATLTAATAVVERPAVDLYSRLSHLVGRVTTLNRTLGWLEGAGSYAGLGVLSWWQLGQLLVVTEPYPMLPRYVMEAIATQWEEEHKTHGTASSSSSSGQGMGAGGGWSRRLRPRSSNSKHHSSSVDDDKPQQQQQQRHVPVGDGTSFRTAFSSRLLQHKPLAQQRISRGGGVRLGASLNNPSGAPTILSATMDQPSSWPSHKRVWGPGPVVPPVDSFNLTASAPVQVQPLPWPAQGDSHTSFQQERTQQQHQPMLADEVDFASIYDNLRASPAHPGPDDMCGPGLAAGAGVSTLPAPPAGCMALAPGELQQGDLLQQGDVLEMLQLCDVLLEGGLEAVPGQEEVEGAALDALLDMLLE